MGLIIVAVWALFSTDPGQGTPSKWIDPFAKKPENCIDKSL
jgi:hypothetical protein